MKLFDLTETDSLPYNWEEQIDNAGISIKDLLRFNGEFKTLEHYYDKALITLERKPISNMPGTVPSLNALFGGLREGELTILTGDVGSGKSTFATFLGYHCSSKEIPIAIFSFEMGPNVMLRKLFCLVTAEDYSQNNLIEHKEKFKTWKGFNKTMLFNRMGVIEYQHFRNALAYAAIQGSRVIIVDHMHCITKGVNISDAAQALEEITMDLHNLAVQLQLHILLICHPAKLRDQGKNRDVTPDDLKGSSGIKQYADNVMSITFDKEHQYSKLILYKIRHDDYGHNQGKEMYMKLNIKRKDYIEVTKNFEVEG